MIDRLAHKVGLHSSYFVRDTGVYVNRVEGSLSYFSAGFTYFVNDHISLNLYRKVWLTRISD